MFFNLRLIAYLQAVVGLINPIICFHKIYIVHLLWNGFLQNWRWAPHPLPPPPPGRMKSTGMYSGLLSYFIFIFLGGWGWIWILVTDCNSVVIEKKVFIWFWIIVKHENILHTFISIAKSVNVFFNWKDRRMINFAWTHVQ